MHKQFLRKSESCIRKAISFEAGNSGFWNLLGLVAFSADDNGLAQHAFIKSVTLDNNPVAWTNLGILYLVLGLVYRFHHFLFAVKNVKYAANREFFRSSLQTPFKMLKKVKLLILSL